MGKTIKEFLMKRGKILGMAGITLTFMVVGFSLIFTGCASMGGERTEYVPANWTMEETTQYPSTSASSSNLRTFSTGGLAALGRSADDRDGEAIRAFVQSASARELTWYLVTAPERPDTYYYVVFHNNAEQTRWSVEKFTGISEYIPVWSMAKMTDSPPPPNTLENVSPTATQVNARNHPDEDVNGILRFRRFFTNDYEAQWYMCTSPEKPGVIYFYRDNTVAGVVSIPNVDIYRQN